MSNLTGMANSTAANMTCSCFGITGYCGPDIPSPTPPTPTPSSGGLSGGAVAGIIIGCVVAVVILAVLVFKFCKKDEHDADTQTRLVDADNERVKEKSSSDIAYN